MTFTPEAQFDPSALEAAVSRLDFTPTGVTVWLRGTVNTDDLPEIGADEMAVWLVNEAAGQRFLLVATSDSGKAALAAASGAPPGSMTFYGRATRADGTSPVAVHVEGGSENE